MAKEKRFEVIVEESSILDTCYRVVCDKATGVQYLVVIGASGGLSVTPLLGADGKPVVGE